MDASAVASELAQLHDRAGLAAAFTSRDPGFTPASGYAAARQLHARRLAAGWTPVGRKIGFTNRSLWERYGVYEPIWGTVYDRTLTRAAGNQAQVSLAGLAQPRIEPEICFGLKAPPPRSRNPEALLGAIEWIAHSVEIVQCHHPEWKFTLADCTADNGLHGHLVLGTPVEIGRISGLAAALPFLKVALSCNGEVRDRGVASVVLDSPLMALAHLVEVLANQPGAEPLRAGEIISTGTITDAHPVKAGETWSTDLHGFAVRGLEISFT